MADKIKMYGNHWCPDCRRALRIFEKMNCDFEFIDVDQDEAAKQLVKDLNYGYCSVPTIIFLDGSTLTEPDNFTLERKLQSLCG